MLAALLKYTDVTSLRVGIPTADGFKSLTVEFIAKQTGMTLKRCERAVVDLKKAGLLTVSQPRQLLPDGRWVGLAAVKAVSAQLFAVFGLSTMLRYERDKASKRLARKAVEWKKKKEVEDNLPGTRTDKARFQLFLGAVSGDGKPKPKPKLPNSPAQDERRRKLIMHLAVKFKLENPDWPSSKCHFEAECELDLRNTTSVK